MENVRWGIIGCGNVTEVKSGPGFQETPSSSLAHVMRRNGDLARDYARRHGVPRWSDDARSLLRDPDVDAVYVATPPGSHLEYSLACAEAGKPCYVEKPMARNFGECAIMVEAFRQAGVPLFVAYYRRALPRFLKIKAILDSGVLGTLRYVALAQDKRAEPEDSDPLRRPWRLTPELSGGGLLLDVGSHTLDLLDFLFGPVEEVDGYAANRAGLYGPEDFVSGSFRFRSGLAGTGRWCFCSPVDREFVEVVGDRGLLRFSVYGNEPLRLECGGTAENIEAPNPVHIQQPLIRTIVEQLTGRGECPSTGESGSRTSRVMDRLLEGYRRLHGDDGSACFADGAPRQADSPD